MSVPLAEWLGYLPILKDGDKNSQLETPESCSQAKSRVRLSSSANKGVELLAGALPKLTFII